MTEPKPEQRMKPVSFWVLPGISGKPSDPWPLRGIAKISGDRVTALLSRKRIKQGSYLHVGLDDKRTEPPIRCYALQIYAITAGRYLTRLASI